MEELNMSRPFEPINFADRGVVTAMTPGGVRGTLVVTVQQAVARAIVAGLLLASLLIGAVSFAAVATAKGQEGGVVCTGTELTAGSCHAQALQATPIGSMPLGCHPSSGDTMACGRRGSHDIAPAAQSAGSAANGPTQASATQPGTRSGVTAGAQPQASRHVGR
jgi:hypothetical protein